jgi:hypothetical protein
VSARRRRSTCRSRHRSRCPSAQEDVIGLHRVTPPRRRVWRASCHADDHAPRRKLGRRYQPNFLWDLPWPPRAVPIPAVVVGRITQQTLRESKLVKRRRSGYEGVRPDVSRSSIIGYRGRMHGSFQSSFSAAAAASPGRRPDRVQRNRRLFVAQRNFAVLLPRRATTPAFPPPLLRCAESNEAVTAVDKPTCLCRALHKDECRFSFMNLRSSSHEHL